MKFAIDIENEEIKKKVTKNLQDKGHNIVDCIKDKSKISMPILSEEQKDVNEQKLLIAYYSKSKINISYYQNGNINLINSYIKKIDFTYHKIYFENKTILFDQIVSLN